MPQTSATHPGSSPAESEYVQRAERAGLHWKDARELSEAEVERRLFAYAGRHEPSERAAIDFAWVHRDAPGRGDASAFVAGVPAVAGAQDDAYRMILDSRRPQLGLIWVKAAMPWLRGLSRALS